MTLPSECVNETQTVCMECGKTIDLRVHCSVAGYYIGFCCPNCGPYSRESGYFHSRNEAETVLDLGDFGRL